MQETDTTSAGPLAPRACVNLMRIYTILFWFSNALTLPFVSTYASQLGAGKALVGLTVSVYSVAPIFMRLVFGILADYFHLRKKFVVLGAALMSAAMLGTYVSGTVGGLLLCRLVQGVASSTWACVSVLYSSYYPKGLAVSASAHLTLGNSAGSLLGYLAGGLVGHLFPLRSIFLVAGLGAICGFFVSLRLLDSSFDTPTPSVKTIAAVAGSSHLLLIAFAAMLTQMIQGVTAWGFTPQLAQSLGGAPMDTTVCSLCFSVPALFSISVLMPRMIRHMGRKNSAVAATAVLSVSCLMQSLVRTRMELFLTCILMGFSSNLSLALLMGLSIAHFPDELRGSAMGLFQSIYAVGLLVGPMAGGLIWERADLRAIFAVIGLVSMLGPLVLLFFYNSTVRTQCRQYERPMKEGKI